MPADLCLNALSAYSPSVRSSPLEYSASIRRTQSSRTSTTYCAWPICSAYLVCAISVFVPCAICLTTSMIWPAPFLSSNLVAFGFLIDSKSFWIAAMTSTV
ncbi:hypothetical protein OGATHE_003884 [Ogataea polymorpha]|uniref:Uncharacterized protein n=1 Tax=Ogataea polymorpha TaxID=460523 RepID=A0A9P8P5H1_9ASCO|nr:hypothetical protein OGATHE_003884 [Ogataea polymorpha]